mgnify:CR=1 FL=1
MRDDQLDSVFELVSSCLLILIFMLFIVLL